MFLIDSGLDRAHHLLKILDAAVYLNRTLDKMELSAQLYYIWKEWTSGQDFLDLTSKPTFAFKFILWMLR